LLSGGQITQEEKKQQDICNNGAEQSTEAKSKAGAEMVVFG